MKTNRIDYPPQGVFKGRNFMTPDIVDYFRGTLRGKTAYVELSTGRGIYGEKIFGVTVADINGRKFDPDPSCHAGYTLNGAMKYIEEME